MEKNTTPTGNISTMAHELVARDEQLVSLFFVCIAIQYYVNKEMLVQRFNPPVFIKFFSDIEMYASQRVLIKNIITNKKYGKVLEELKSFFRECNDTPGKNPYDIFLSRINKAYLIRQVFHHTDQVLDKFTFIDSFVNLEIGKLNLDDLYDKMWKLQVEVQILILARILSTTKDSLEDKKKTIINSFYENVSRMQDEIKKNSSRHTPIEITNIVSYEKFISELNRQQTI